MSASTAEATKANEADVAVKPNEADETFDAEANEVNKAIAAD